MKKNNQIYRVLAVVLYFLCFACSIHAQQQATKPDSSVDKDFVVPEKAMEILARQYKNMSFLVQKQNEKILQQIQRHDLKLYKRLKRKDSLLVKNLFSEELTAAYNKLSANNTLTPNSRFPLKTYLPEVDSLQTALFFMQKKLLCGSLSTTVLKSLQEQLKIIQQRLENADDIQSFIKEREVLLKEKLVNSNLHKDLLFYNKRIYYYQQKAEEYRNLLNDKDKLKTEIIGKVNKLPAFQNFWQKYSYLAQLFPQQSSILPTTGNGLQTINEFQAIIADRLGAIQNPTDFFQQQVSSAQEKLAQLKDKISSGVVGNTSSDIVQPDFKPNDLHNKKLTERIEYGFTIQNNRARGILPVTSDISVHAGFRFSKQLVAGLGINYKLGWGESIRDISLSHEGIGLRTYGEMKIDKILALLETNIWLTGGFESNYFSRFESLRAIYLSKNRWQSSALLGLTNKTIVGMSKGKTRKSKEMKVQILYDFLWNQVQPTGEKLVFRIGYNL